MANGIIPIDDQPIAATFFGEGKWLTEFITPDALEVKTLYDKITKNRDTVEGRIDACHAWVASQVKYKQFISGTIEIEGKKSRQTDLWMNPSMVILTQVGNCANKSFLLASLLRNTLPPTQVHTVLGNLYNGKPGGHAWVEVRLNERDYVSETTRPDVPALVMASIADRYEPVHYFNDKEAYAIEGRTVMEPFQNYYSTWLVDYLDWCYIEGNKR